MEGSAPSGRSRPSVAADPTAARAFERSAEDYRPSVRDVARLRMHATSSGPSRCPRATGFCLTGPPAVYTAAATHAGRFSVSGYWANQSRTSSERRGHHSAVLLMRRHRSRYSNVSSNRGTVGDRSGLTRRANVPQALTLIRCDRMEGFMEPTFTPTWSNLLPRYREYLESGTLSPRTVELRLYHLNRVRRFVEVEVAEVTLEHLASYSRGRDWSANTKAVVRASISVFFRWATDNEYMTKNPASRLMPVRVPPGKPKPANDEALRDAYAIASPKVWLMLALGARAGLRAMEIAQVSTYDLERESGGYSLRILGKGAKVRLVPLEDDLAEKLLDRPAGFVFPGQVAGHISPAYVSRLVSSVLPKGVTAHKLRHRFATRAYRGSGNNLRAVQELLGHSSIATTQVYTGVGSDELRHAALSARSDWDLTA